LARRLTLLVELIGAQLLVESGWLYVEAVLDLYPRRVVGWSMQNSMTGQLVIDALMMTL
jgi:transposase InsO family protein